MSCYVHVMFMSCSCHHFNLRRSAKIISQFTCPAKSLFNSAELGSKAFSYVSAILNSFLTAVLGFSPISQSLDPTDRQSITQSLIRSAQLIRFVTHSSLVNFAFSYSLCGSQFFLHCGARHLPNQPLINSITQSNWSSVNHSVSWHLWSDLSFTLTQ
jgi:hypothetical protein